MTERRHDGSTPTRAERGRARAIWNRLVSRYPIAHTALHYRTPWELLVVTVLSAQTTDETVNRISPALFSRYASPAELADAELEDVEQIIFSTGFYRQKASAVVELAADIVERFDGVVPSELEQLTQLKGVGRKTASVVLSEAFGAPAIAVDTHVKRVSGRLGLTAATDPVKIEQDLKALFPRKHWAGLSMRVIQFGRDVCEAKRPRCDACEMRKLCPWPNKPTAGG